MSSISLEFAHSLAALIVCVQSYNRSDQPEQTTPLALKEASRQQLQLLLKGTAMKVLATEHLTREGTEHGWCLGSSDLVQSTKP